MTYRRQIIPSVITLMVLVTGVSACQLPIVGPILQSPTPQPTYTPYPSPETWEVEVISTIRSTTFGELFWEPEQNTTFLIVTLQYTYLGEDRTEFFPMSVLLLAPDGSTYPGWAATTGFYQPENTTAIQNFGTTRPPIIYILHGETRIEKFAWSMVADTTDSWFLLLFPQTSPIVITISSQ